MDLQIAKSRVNEALESAKHLLADSAGDRLCKAISKYHLEFNSVNVPILFQHLTIERARNLEGILKDKTLNESSSKAIENVLECLQNVGDEIVVAIEKQIDIDRACGGASERKISKEIGIEKYTILSPEVADTTKAIVDSLTSLGNLSEESFDPLVRLSKQDFEARSGEWLKACHELLKELPVQHDSEIIGWIGSDVVSTTWSEVLKYLGKLFEDEYFLPADASWLLFFFHHDSLECGKRKLTRNL